jgi:alkylation response protein AidB-like acyl-CoA dehydrogenase
MSPATAAERAQIRAMTRELAYRELAPRAAVLDAGGQDEFARCWRLLSELGLDRMLLGEQHGGAGLCVPDLLVTLEELAVGDAGIAMCVLLSNAALATLTGDQLADAPAARWVLVPAAPGAALEISDGRISGRIASALGAHGADRLVIVTGQPQPAAWTIMAGAPGLALQRDVTQMGLRAAPAASIEMTGVKSAAGSADGNSPVTASTGPADALTLLHAGTAAIAHGIARRAYQMALEYARARRQGGIAIIEHDAVSDMLSAMAVRLACWPQTAGGHGPEPGRAQALAAKIAATDAAAATTTDAVQVFGGTGYMVETGAEKLMRDAKYCQLFPEPNWVAHGQLMRSQRAGEAGVTVVKCPICCGTS